MLTIVQDTVLQYLPPKRKTNSSGWTSFNGVCCHHNGESADTRGRAGVTTSPDGGISYHCFNCNFKTGYKPGRHLSYKFRKLLTWLGADENTVRRLVIEALRVKDLVAPESVKTEPEEEITFKARPLPEGVKTFDQWHTWFTLNAEDPEFVNVPADFADAVQYIMDRKIDAVKYNLMWTPEEEHNYHKRVVIPFTWKNEIIGSTARTFLDGIKPKYYNEHEPNYVFNVDKQDRDNKFVLVMEGPFDAMSVDGVAILGSDCNEIQADIIESLGKEVIVVPDFDMKIIKGKKVWTGAKLIDYALEYGWAVSFPSWGEQCKDAAKAVETYGKLFTLKAILEGKQTSKLKIELMRKRIYS